MTDSPVPAARRNRPRPAIDVAATPVEARPLDELALAAETAADDADVVVELPLTAAELLDEPDAELGAVDVVLGAVDVVLGAVEVVLGDVDVVLGAVDVVLGGVLGTVLLVCGHVHM